VTRTLTSRQQAEELGAAEQGQQALELASMGGGGVELEGKSASIKSISDSIQSSNACSLSSCSVSFFSCSISLLSCLRSISRSILLCSAAGSRRQLSIDKNERKRESDEPDAPLLLHGDDASKEGDVVIGGEQRNQSNHNAGDGLKHSRRIDRATAWPGLHRRAGSQSRSPERQFRAIVRPYWSHQVALGSWATAAPPATSTRRP
jgi:hypothetical protein